MFNTREIMQAISQRDSTGILDVPEHYDAEECQTSEATWLAVNWRSVESWQPPLQFRAPEDGICRWPDDEPAEPQLLAELSMLMRVSQYIEAHYPEDLCLDLVARALGADPLHLGTLIKEATEMDFSDHLATTRVEKAKNLLLNPNYYFIEVASGVGFESLSQFGQTFTRLVGEPPHAYRARLPAMLHCEEREA